MIAKKFHIEVFFEHKPGDKMPKKTLKPKGFYYQGKNDIVLVGDIEKNHTIRQKFSLDEIAGISIINKIN